MARFSTLRLFISRTRRAVLKARGRPVLPRGIRMGKGCTIFSNDFDGGFGRHITLGDEVVVSARVRILCHDAARGYQTGVYRIAPVKVGSRTFIGADSVVLAGVTIGEDVVVGAGSVITKDVPDGVIVAGNPARQVGTSADLDRRRLALLDSLPAFDASLYNRDPVPTSRLAELDRAVRDEGGYVLIDRNELERSRVRLAQVGD